MKDDVPTLLARVGKISDVDPDSGNPSCMISKMLRGGSLARLADEGITRNKENHVRAINYKAYAINYEQVKEFLILIAQIEKKQLNNSKIMDGMDHAYGAEASQHDSIRCYVPTSEEEDLVTFEYKRLRESLFWRDLDNYQEISCAAQALQYRNTCRTTALRVFETILGFVTGVSEYFFIAPRYLGYLRKGQPEKSTFYVLPSPPNASEHEFTPKQRMVLDKLYKRMEDVPTLESDSQQTRDKFNALKTAYKEIAGSNNLSAAQLLQKIVEHEKKKEKELFSKRAPWFFSRCFNIPSTTEKMFKEIERNLQNELAGEPTPNSVAIPIGT